MSYGFSFSGHIEPQDLKKDEVVRKAAAAFVATLDAAGIVGGGNVFTPSGSYSFSSPSLHVRPDGPGGTATGGKPK